MNEDEMRARITVLEEAVAILARIAIDKPTREAFRQQLRNRLDKTDATLGYADAMLRNMDATRPS